MENCTNQKLRQLDQWQYTGNVRASREVTFTGLEWMPEVCQPTGYSHRPHELMRSDRLHFSVNCTDPLDDEQIPFFRYHKGSMKQITANNAYIYLDGRFCITPYTAPTSVASDIHLFGPIRRHSSGQRSVDCAAVTTTSLQALGQGSFAPLDQHLNRDGVCKVKCYDAPAIQAVCATMPLHTTLSEHLS
jgi:hypothetical protein